MGRHSKTVMEKLNNAEAITNDLVAENEQLRQQLALLQEEKREAQPNDVSLAVVLAQQAEIMKNIAGNTVPKVNFKQTLNQPYVLSAERKQEIEDILAQYAEKGIVYKWDKDSPSVTFRRKIDYRYYDKEAEGYVRDKRFVYESFHASVPNAHIKARLADMCHLRSTPKDASREEA
ncbi:MAG: hypothetical protein KGJ90_05155 [Patescibacteria group bacterium]|nr:hypothetical protein [Patescibacteria group bacterium]